MSITPLAYADSLRVGTVDFVSPDDIKVQLDIEAPESVALNTGTPRAFPRINGYLLIPSDEGYLVGQVEWITIERSQYPKRKGMQDFGLIDLPFPLRKLSLNPLGTLSANGKNEAGNHRYKFRRGVDAFPSVGDSVLLPSQDQLRDIIESGENRRVKIGTSILAGNAEVKIDPNRLFGRHLAVLGNTGSGKSCSVAGLIRWSLEAAKNESGDKEPSARFIILDPNGEYSKAFKDFKGARLYSVDPSDDREILQVPLWFWNSAEWCAFTQASGQAQKPLLKRAIREIKNGGGTAPNDPKFELRRKISSIFISVRNLLRSGASYEGWKLGPKLVVFATDIEAYSYIYSDYTAKLVALKECIDGIISADGQTYSKRDGSIGYNDFPATSIEVFETELSGFIDELGGIVYLGGPNEDTPVPFTAEQFLSHITELASQESNPQFFDYLLMRIQSMLSDARMKVITQNPDTITLDKWLSDYVGVPTSESAVTVIDLSLVPAEIVHIITTVIARITFESLQRYRKLHSEHKTLPTVLVMEEAHTFIKRYKEEAENHDAAAICCQLFEKIAREGRKFGLGLVLSSQRPSELSPTVLSQCNTFLLHRISNDRDQELVHKLVPDNLKGLLRDMPSLPSQSAILLGWASELPVLVRMNDLPKHQQPQSDDPDFWEVWTGSTRDDAGKVQKVTRPVNWKQITDDWQQVSSASSQGDETPTN